MKVYGSGQLHAPSALPRERASVTDWMGDWVGPRTALDDVDKRKALLLRDSNSDLLSRVASSQSLYRMRYPDSLQIRKAVMLIYTLFFHFHIFLIIFINTVLFPCVHKTFFGNNFQHLYMLNWRGFGRKGCGLIEVLFRHWL
jgi:hypothetical protein